MKKLNNLGLLNSQQYSDKMSPILVHGLKHLIDAAAIENDGTGFSVPMSEVTINGVLFEVQLKLESKPNNFLKDESITIYGE